jgi:hypothetical protein
MIVKLRINNIDSYYECRKAYVDLDPPRNADVPDYITIRMEQDDYVVDINKRDNPEIFLMNEQGKTFQKYQFFPEATLVAR